MKPETIKAIAVVFIIGVIGFFIGWFLRTPEVKEVINEVEVNREVEVAEMIFAELLEKRLEAEENNTEIEVLIKRIKVLVETLGIGDEVIVIPNELKTVDLPNVELEDEVELFAIEIVISNQEEILLELGEIIAFLQTRL